MNARSTESQLPHFVETAVAAPSPSDPYGGGAVSISNSALARRIEAAKHLRAEIACLVAGEQIELSDADRQTIRDTFEGETTLEVEIASAIRAADDDLVLMHGIDARMKELRERRERLECRDEMRIGLIEAAMIALGQDKLETPLGTVSLRRNPSSVVVDDESEIPTQFFTRPEPVLNKTSIRKVLVERHKAIDTALTIKDERTREDELWRVEREHPPLPGCYLETELRSLQIRRK